MQIAASAIDQSLRVVGGEATSALGTAYVAAMGAGLFGSWHDIEHFIVQGPLYQPQAADVARYRTGFALYRDLYMRLQTFLPQLGKFDEGDENGQ
jgi:sugar (pentulose or hexulose) kinase